MATKVVIFACALVAVFSTAYTQCVNRLVPNCGCSNILPIAETILPNQILYNNIPNQLLVNPCGNIDILPTQLGVPTQLAVPTTTIIQDSTVANNLANALQLLVVSNLLSNTLPLGDTCGCAGIDYLTPIASPVVPSCGCNGFGPYNYVY